MGSTITATQGKKMVQVSAVVVRCGCTDKQKASPKWHARHDKPCPNPRDLEDRGVVAYWHQNVLKRLAYRVKLALFGKV